MPNMSYCRFENTSRDLQDCVDHWEDELLFEGHEKHGKERIIKLAQLIVEMEAE